MKSNWRASLPAFSLATPGLELTPAELEAVTGLTPEMQRVWRSRGHIEKLKGSQARYTVRDAAQILVGYELTKWGLPPEKAMNLALVHAASVVQHALFNVDATCEVQGEKGDVEAFAKAFEEETDSPLIRFVAGNDGDGLPNYIVSEDHSDIVPTDMLPDFGTLTGFISIQVLDLVQAGIRLAERVGRPLVKVEVGERSEWSRNVTRRVLGGHER